ncbi:MAG: hypothetical protein IKP84_01270 [Prevotella sp.]|nr:hypothetical protein [Prevotella sp.]
MALPKFIITMDGHLTSSKSLTLGHSSRLDGSRSIATFRLGMVNQHKDLLKPGEQCIGGGYYHFDYTTNRILLDRESYDFGRPRWHLLDTLRVPSVYRGLRLVYSYDDNFHDDFNVSEELNIEYYD